MTPILAVAAFIFGQIWLASSACPEFVDWYSKTKACAMIYAGNDCTGTPLELHPGVGIRDIRREFELSGIADDDEHLTALVRPLCTITYYNDAEGKSSTTLEEDDGEPWLQPRSSVWSADCECTLKPSDLLGSCVPTEGLTTVGQCDNSKGSTAIACEYTTRFWPSYIGYPNDVEDDGERISAGEESALRSVISQKFPDHPLDSLSRDKLTGSKDVPAYHLLRIEQRYFKCGAYVWPMPGPVVTNYVRSQPPSPRPINSVVEF